ncbi:MAG: OmpH family outer membrane protein [Gammaproteobacteria bacterium]
MIRKGFIAAVLLAGLAVAPAAAFADTKIGVVSMARLLEQSPQAVEVRRSIQEEFAPRERQIREKQEELRKLQEQLSQGEGFMAEDERRRVEREFREGQRELSRSQNEWAEDLNVRQNEQVGQLQRVFVEEVRRYGEAQGYDLILTDGIIHVSSGLDITPQILEALQRRYQADQGG